MGCQQSLYDNKGTVVHMDTEDFPSTRKNSFKRMISPPQKQNDHPLKKPKTKARPFLQLEVLTVHRTVGKSPRYRPPTPWVGSAGLSPSVVKEDENEDDPDHDHLHSQISDVKTPSTPLKGRSLLQSPFPGKTFSFSLRNCIEKDLVSRELTVSSLNAVMLDSGDACHLSSPAQQKSSLGPAESSNGRSLFQSPHPGKAFSFSLKHLPEKDHNLSVSSLNTVMLDSGDVCHSSVVARATESEPISVDDVIPF
jgi:hypothetical protein